MPVDRERLASWGKSFLLLILIAQLLGLLIIFRGEGDSTEPDQTAQAPPAESEPSNSATQNESESDDSTVAQEDTSNSGFSGIAQVNRQGGYRFRYPAGWQIEQVGTATEATSSDEKVKVTFGLAPAGDLLSASQQTVSAIQDEYGDVIVTQLHAASVGGRAARFVQGKATNADGVRLLFRSVTVHGRGETFAIVAFESADPSGKMNPTVEMIIDTFRQTRAGSRSVSAAPTNESASAV
jgi:cytoskeletal protein RodZ